MTPGAMPVTTAAPPSTVHDRDAPHTTGSMMECCTQTHQSAFPPSMLSVTPTKSFPQSAATCTSRLPVVGVVVCALVLGADVYAQARLVLCWSPHTSARWRPLCSHERRASAPCARLHCRASFRDMWQRHQCRGYRWQLWYQWRCWPRCWCWCWCWSRCGGRQHYEHKCGPITACLRGCGTSSKTNQTSSTLSLAPAPDRFH